jgi:tRNA threonylcarbamoyladenosine modification (KEOPS) complex Cgi121 subunit
MHYSRISSDLDAATLTKMAISHQILLLEPEKVASIQSLELAAHLADSAFTTKTNIATKPHLEFLLWLAARKDISAAVRSFAFSSPSNMLAIGLGTKSEFDGFLAKINAKKLPLALEKTAKPEELERISLSRIAN